MVAMVEVTLDNVRVQKFSLFLNSFLGCSLPEYIAYIIFLRDNSFGYSTFILAHDRYMYFAKHRSGGRHPKMVCITT